MKRVFTPRPYQELIRDHILDNKRCAVWADMGLGKTASTLSALEILKLCGSKLFPALVVAPLRVARSTWTNEVDKWTDFEGLRVQPILGPQLHRAHALRASADVYTVNFDNVQWLIDAVGGPDKWPFRATVIDEATRLKGLRLRGGTKRSKMLYEATKPERCGRFIELTGTPAPNGLKDLWGQVQFLDYGQRLGESYTDFISRWFKSNTYTHEVTPQGHAMEQISAAVRDICLTVRAQDYFDLRAPIRVPVYCELPSAARATYRQLEKEMYTTLDATVEVDVVNAAALSSKCLQLASGAVIGQDNGKRKSAGVHDAKLDALESIVEEANGAPLLVGYWWKHDLERICARFPFARPIRTKKDEDDWNAGRIMLAPAHYQSLGHGLNLQDGGHRFVHYSRWWDAELDEQLRARIGPVRQMQSGYDRPVYEYEIVCRDTIDEDVSYTHEAKLEVQDVLRDKTRRRT